ncbi:DUF3341 domain-containing protein [Caulobacter sp. S45]|jgi:hypothetical protein|uniref:DUF3341 domain-containing protein n=1 Tax=Caulobacter sp. S45 TaxID=1641861 RepID=UPI00131C6EC4|nr:DUF3341 domain-containing protein [Caulobacter sp. S45]
MSHALLAAFAAPEPLMRMVQQARDKSLGLIDAFTPYPIEGLSEALGQKPTQIPWWMLGGGVAMAVLFYAMEWLSATRLYPFDQGGRPLNSWPTFIVATVEISVLTAALTGFVAMLVKAGLPRLHHPLFECGAFERASQDQFLLAIAAPEDAQAAGAARQALWDAGAVWIEEVAL